MPALDYFIIFLFTLMVLIVGLSFSRTGGKGMKSYFAAGGALPWWLSGLSLFMSFFSAGTFVVWGSIAYKYGWVAISIQWMMALGGLFIGFFIAARWKSQNVLTVGEYLGNRFGEKLKKFYSYIFLLLSFVMTGAFLYPVAKLFNVSTGFSIELSIIILGLLIIAYTSAGGLWAVIVTDVLQFVILFAAVIIVVPLAFDKVGGYEGFINGAPDDFFKLINGEYTFWFLFAFLFYNTIFIGGNWAYVQRYTSVKTTGDAKKVAWLFGILYVVSPILWMIPPMIFRSMDGSLVGLEDEGAFLLICKEVLPKGLLGLMLGGMIFATASSVNTSLNMTAAVFTNDIYKRLKKNATEKSLINIAKGSTVFFGIFTIIVAMLIPRLGGIVEVVLSFGAITGAPLYGPPIWALFSNRQTSFSIITTTVLSLALNCFFKFLSPTLLDFSLDRAGEMLAGVLIPLGILALFEVYYLLTPTTKSSPQKYEAVTSPESKEGVNTSSDENRFALRVLGIALALTGILICILGVLATHGKAIVIAIGALIIMIGAYFVRITRNLKLG